MLLILHKATLPPTLKAVRIDSDTINFVSTVALKSSLMG